VSNEEKPRLLRAADIAARATSYSHPWNPQSEVRLTILASLTGLERTGVDLARIAPGKESWVYHAHHREEEWAYVISGRALVEIGDETHEIGAGDFVGFATPSPAHHIRNPFAEEFVYLCGGEHQHTEIVDFPRLGRRLVREGDQRLVYDIADANPFPAHRR
jgi:uncharacterized cupin superfamily protein